MCSLESFIHLFERPLPDLFPVFEGAFLSPPFLAIYRPPFVTLISEIREFAKLWLSPTTVELTGVANPELLLLEIQTSCGRQNLGGLSPSEFMQFGLRVILHFLIQSITR